MLKNLLFYSHFHWSYSDHLRNVALENTNDYVNQILSWELQISKLQRCSDYTSFPWMFLFLLRRVSDRYMNNCPFYQVTKMPSKGDLALFILVNCMDRLFISQQKIISPSLSNVAHAFTPDIGKLNQLPSSSGSRSYASKQSAIYTQLSDKCSCSVLLKLFLFV